MKKKSSLKKKPGMKNVANSIIVLGIILLVAGGILLFAPQDTAIPEPEASKEEGQQSRELPTTCSGIAIPELTEGPYYREGSPEEQIIAGADTPTIPLVLEGYVFDTDCKPIAGAWIDFWQANGEGVYDNEGYILRGHQYTDENGKYHVLTVVPGMYPGRTEHIHFKIKATDTSEIVTSQLFLPDKESNAADELFDPALVISMHDDDSGPGKTATYNFVIER